MNHDVEFTGSIKDQTVTLESGMLTIALSGFSDMENDPILFSATSDNMDVATVAINNTDLNIFVVGIGEAIIEISATDTPGEIQAASSFKVTVEPEPLPEFVYEIDFAFSDGMAESVIDYEGLSISFVSYDTLSTFIIEDGVLLWEEYSSSQMIIAFDSAVDLSRSSEIQFDYADLWSGSMNVFFTDSSGNSSSETIALLSTTLITNDTVFNTLAGSLLLKDFAAGANLDAVSSITLEKFGGNLLDSGGTWKLDNVNIGKIE